MPPIENHPQKKSGKKKKKYLSLGIKQADSRKIDVQSDITRVTSTKHELGKGRES